MSIFLDQSIGFLISINLNWSVYYKVFFSTGICSNTFVQDFNHFGRYFYLITRIIVILIIFFCLVDLIVLKIMIEKYFITFFCPFLNKGLINNILSARFWIPLSRINYSTCIVHIDVINVIVLNIEASMQYTTFTLVCIYLKHSQN